MSKLVERLKEAFGRIWQPKERHKAEQEEITEAEKIADDILEALGEAKENKE